MTLSPSSVADEHKSRPRKRNQAIGATIRVFRHRLGMIGGTVMVLLVLAAVLAPVISPHSPFEINYESFLQPPSWTHPFGTDELGRDILTRVLYGSQASLQVMAISIIGALLIGSAVGVISGYFGGWLDEILMRIVDGLLSFPAIVLALAIVAALGPSLTNAIIAIAIVNVPDFARLVRGQVIAIRSFEYVQAAKAIGLSPVRLMWRHVWPSVRGSVIIYSTLKAAQAIITESALSFLGLGVQPPQPTWGSMLSTAMRYGDQWWMSVFPGLAIFVTVLALNLLGDALRDVLDATTR
ncbi:ABC transporter permease [Salipiger marinus]|uniref:ABC transporter permease n=1 Tax=Salipiger marinus TaxID=555512 RepID=UPI002C151834|nr:ABC transporter permease [Salipiger manganoxidans]MEB3419302.1 ABC transporter permease [Salipiger manganoxidans]